MFGIILGFGAAIAFAFNAVVTRRGVLRASSNYVANISILTGPVLSLIVASVTGHLYEIGDFPWQALVFFSLSGIVHFAHGSTSASTQIDGDLIIQGGTLNFSGTGTGT